jgi:isoquinoline 1-oxidoreductase alpha subunit
MPALTINGKRADVDCEPDTPLLWAIRDAAGLTGTPPGCLVGLCGACTIHIDGEPARSCCLAVAQAEGCGVTTIEGVLRTSLGRALELAWSEGRILGCDQCRPGRIMVAAALLAQVAEPSDAQAAAALAGHACDCGEMANAADVGDVLRRAARDARDARTKASTVNAEHRGGMAVDAPSAAFLAPVSERTTR